MIAKSLSFLALAIGLSVPGALAQSNQAPSPQTQDITGAWSFKTKVKRKGCTLTGNMSISPPSESGARTCSFVSSESCEVNPERVISVEQTCRITPQADRYIIRSQVISSLTEGYSMTNYLPDHFVVKPTDPKEMKGIWQDAQYSAPVIFWRDENLAVS